MEIPSPLPAFASDFTLESVEGEASRDSSSSKSTYVVAGDQVTLTTQSRGHGRNPGGEEPPPPKTAKLTNTPELDAALTAIRATKDDTKSPALINTRYWRACLIEGKMERCSTVTQGTSARLDALQKLEQLLLAEVMK